jgi:hypothetical protein
LIKSIFQIVIPEIHRSAKDKENLARGARQCFGGFATLQGLGATACRSEAQPRAKSNLPQPPWRLGRFRWRGHRVSIDNPSPKNYNYLILQFIIFSQSLFPGPLVPV